MEKGVYSVFDSKAKVFSNPFFAINIATALRSFTTAANDVQSDICRYPSDFTLFQIGTFDDTTGLIKSFPPENLGLAVQFKEQLTFKEVLNNV